MMFRAEKMLKVNILLLARHVTETTRILGRTGLLHLVDAPTQSSAKLLKGAGDGEDGRDVEKLLHRVEDLLDAMGVEEPAEPVSPKEEMPLSDIQPIVQKINDKYLEQAKVLETLLADFGNADRKLSAVKDYPLKTVNLEILNNLSRFFMATGHLPLSRLPRAVLTLKEKAIIVSLEDAQEDVLVLSSNQNRASVCEQLEKLGFEAKKAPDGAGTADELEKSTGSELFELHRKIANSRMNILKLSEQYGSLLLLMRARLNELNAVAEARRHFGVVSRLFCISGWTPEASLPTLRNIVEQATDGTAVIEAIPAEEDEAVQDGRDSIPVKLKGGPLAKAFQMLVCNFGTPNYKEIDPTLFVGVTFILFFGYMFGDVGQGLVLFLAGLWMLLSKKAMAMLKQSAPLFMACGVSSMLFGFAYGSVFGYEHLVHHLWVNPLQSAGITKLLLTAIGIGVVVSSVSVIINIINHFIAKKYFEGIFDRFGLLGLCFYWVALWLGLYAIKYGRFPMWGIVMLAVPLVLLALRGFIKMICKPGEENEGLFNTILECGLDLMETITGYMSGTVSFVRIGAFAISHAALCLAIFSIVQMLQKLPGGTIYSAIIIIAGNLLVIGFEGMVACIQAVRLEYYELFGKFYDGTGVPFAPFKLKTDTPAASARSKK